MTIKYFNVKNGLTTGNITLNASNSSIYATSANFTGTTTLGNIVVSTGANLGAIGNIKLAGGTSGQIIQTDGLGNLSFATVNASTLSSDVDEFIGDGIQTEFLLSTIPAGKNYTFVVLQGIMQPKSTYSVSGAVLTFSSAPPETAFIEVTTMGLS